MLIGKCPLTGTEAIDCWRWHISSPENPRTSPLLVCSVACVVWLALCRYQTMHSLSNSNRQIYFLQWYSLPDKSQSCFGQNNQSNTIVSSCRGMTTRSIVPMRLHMPPPLCLRFPRPPRMMVMMACRGTMITGSPETNPVARRVRIKFVASFSATLMPTLSPSRS